MQLSLMPKPSPLMLMMLMNLSANYSPLLGEVHVHVLLATCSPAFACFAILHIKGWIFPLLIVHSESP